MVCLKSRGRTVCLRVEGGWFALWCVLGVS